MTESDHHQSLSYRILKPFTENFAKMVELDFPEEYAILAAQMIADGKYPIVVANHDSQANIFSLAIVSEIIRDLANQLISDETARKQSLEGFYLPAATSLYGKQGLMVAAFFKAIAPFLAHNHIVPLPVTRKQDVQNYGVSEGSKTSSIRELLCAHNTNYGLTLFLTGSVQEARIGKDGKRIGLQPYDKRGIFSQMVLKTNAVIIPIANSTGYEITDPALHNRPTKQALNAFFHNALSPEPRVLSRAVVGRPFCFELPPNFSDHGYINNQTLKVIAEMLPPEQQGAFR